MHIKKANLFFIIFILLSIISIYGCEMTKNSGLSSQLTIKDIAFDVNKKSGYTVYIEENSKFVSYLVLTSNYDGNTLLLRKELMSDFHIFNEEISHYSAYYRDSSIDKFLNKDFITYLDPKIESNIVNSEITISSKSSLGVTGEDTENIFRKVFLLSAAEVGMYTNHSNMTKEGNALKYFKDSKSRIAYRGNEPTCWMLRSPNTWDVSSVFGIGPDGAVGSGSISTIIPSEPIFKSGVRPAFCLRNSQLIKKSDKVIDKQMVYILVK